MEKKRPGFKAKTWDEFLEHLQSKVIRRGPDECWGFTGALTNGYAMLWFDGRLLKCTRVMWEVANGRPIKREMEACHTCDNPGCINPNHIFEGTHLQNMRDMQRKGRDRKARGSEHSSHKLNEDDVKEIHRLYATDAYSYSQIARRFKVGKTTVAKIIRGEKWAHIKKELTENQKNDFVI